MSDEQPPRIEFPCDYPIKVVGDAAPDFRELVIDIVSSHAPEMDPTAVTERQSRNGRFTSLTMTIVATGEPQLRDIFEALKNTGRVHMVL